MTGIEEFRWTPEAIASYLLSHPATAEERAAVARARVGDCCGLWRRDSDGKWEQL